MTGLVDVVRIMLLSITIITVKHYHFHLRAEQTISHWGTHTSHMHNLTQLVIEGLMAGTMARQTKLPMLPNTVVKGMRLGYCVIF